MTRCPCASALPAHLCQAEATRVPQKTFLQLWLGQGLPGIRHQCFSGQLTGTESGNEGLGWKGSALLNWRVLGSRGALPCSALLTEEFHTDPCFLDVSCAPLGCQANRKTSVCYKFSLAKGRFPSLGGNNPTFCPVSALRYEWLPKKKASVPSSSPSSDII